MWHRNNSRDHNRAGAPQLLRLCDCCCCCWLLGLCWSQEARTMAGPYWRKQMATSCCQRSALAPHPLGQCPPPRLDMRGEGPMPIYPSPTHEPPEWITSDRRLWRVSHASRCTIVVNSYPPSPRPRSTRVTDGPLAHCALGGIATFGGTRRRLLRLLLQKP